MLSHSFTGWVCSVKNGLGGEVVLAAGSRRLAQAYDEPENQDAIDACDSTTTTIANPKVTFDSVEQGNYTDVTASFTLESMTKNFTTIDGVFGLVSVSQACSLELSEGFVKEEASSYVKATKRAIVKHGTDFYIHDPRLDLLENTPENPAVHFGLTCPTVPRTPINDDSCKVPGE